MRSALLIAIILGGVVAGTLDVGAAALINKLSPMVILRAIASGLLGKAAFKGGLGVSALGFGLQWFMSILIAAVYGVASGWLPLLSRQWIAMGLAYGIGVFVVMNYVVVPLSAVHRFPSFTVLKFGENLIAMLIFGLIVAYFIHRAGSPINQNA